MLLWKLSSYHDHSSTTWPNVPNWGSFYGEYAKPLMRSHRYSMRYPYPHCFQFLLYWEYHNIHILTQRQNHQKLWERIYDTKKCRHLLQAVGEGGDESLPREPIHVNFCRFLHPLPNPLPHSHLASNLFFNSNFNTVTHLASHLHVQCTCKLGSNFTWPCLDLLPNLWSFALERADALHPKFKVLDI